MPIVPDLRVLNNLSFRAKNSNYIVIIAYLERFFEKIGVKSHFVCHNKFRLC